MTAAPAAPDEPVADYAFAGEARSGWSRALHRFLWHRFATASLVVLIAVFAAGFLAKELAPYNYLQLNINALSEGPSWAHPFGTDQVGRDYFSRVLYAIGTEARIVLIVGFFGTLIGTLVGAVSGYFGGALDNIVMRFTDLMLTLPPLITILVAAAYLHANTLFKVSLLLACFLWMPIARIVRGTTVSLRETAYVESARAMGASDLRIVARHILPNAIGAVSVAASVMTAGAVILETTLSYLGFGVLPTYALVGRTDTAMPSLGDVMAASANEGLFNWWGILFPGLAIVFIVAPIYFVGDGIRDALDPAGQRHAVPARRKRKNGVLPAGLRRWFAAVPRPRFPEVTIRLPHVELPFVERAMAYLRRRPARRRPLALEAAVVLFATAVAGGAVYLFGISSIESPWRVAGDRVQNISQARGAQTEVAIATSPLDVRVLFGASNDTIERTIRVYSSADGGRSWSSKLGPYLGLDACARGEPAVAVTGDGREYVAFVVSSFCTKEDLWPYLVVATRASAHAPWTVQRVVGRSRRDLFDAKPAIAAAPDGRIYVAWSRLLKPTYATTVVSSSDDHGRHWSKPRIVSPKLVQPHLASATVEPGGTLYVAGVDARFGVWVARSGDRGRHFSLGRAGALRFDQWNDPATCSIAQKYPTPFEAIRCLGPNPTVTATGGRVHVTYSARSTNGTYDVFIVVLDPSLRVLWRGRVGPEKGMSDQFWPVSAVDPGTRTLWACYYDTSGDRSREQAWFSCAVSQDGRRWSSPVRVARASANQEVLWEDARIYEFGDMVGYGGYTGLAVSGGNAHPIWIDTRGEEGAQQEIFGARLKETALPR